MVKIRNLAVQVIRGLQRLCGLLLLIIDVTCPLSRSRQYLCSVVEENGDDDENEGETEVNVEMKVEDDDGQRGGNEHCTRDEKQSRDVTGMLHYRRHYQPDQRL